MSSPPTAPTPSSQNLARTQSQRSHGALRAGTGTNPSTPGPGATPAQQSTPASVAPFLSPNLSRTGNTAGKTTVGGKTIAGKGLAGKGIPGQHVSPPGVAHGSSPAGANMMATPSHGGSTGPGGISTFDSPNHAALAAVGMEPSSSSNAMGLSMSSLGLNNLGAPGASGNLSHLGMVSGLSGGMLGTSSMGMGAGPGKLDDAERRRRLESVLNILGQSKGRISQEGIERLARRMGLEMFDEFRDGGRSLTLAGEKMFAVDVLFRPATSSVVDQTTFSFHDVNETTIADFSPAANILREDLSPPPGTAAINAKLDSFANNLEKISKLERLSVESANCFEAISGIYRSLKKLYEHEQKLAEATAENTTDHAAEVHVICRKSGRPRMNVRRTVGLSIEYWHDQHLVPGPPPATNPQITASDGDQPMPDANDGKEEVSREDDKDNQTYNVHVDVQPCPSSMYPPIRTSNTWISDAVEKPSDNSNDTDSKAKSVDIVPREIDWQEPNPPSLNDPKLAPPEARFIAHLDPPITLPLNVAAQLLASVGANVDLGQEQLQQTTFESLVLGNHPGLSQRLNPGDSITSTIKTMIFDVDGNQSEEQWETRLYFPRPELAKTLDEVPFSHPRQLVALLPILRQYTLFAKLLRSAIAVPVTTPSAEQANPNDPQDELDALLAEIQSSTGNENNNADTSYPRVLDVTITHLTPNPRLSLILPTPAGLLTTQITIGSNAEVNVLASNDATAELLSGTEGEERSARKVAFEQAMTKALRVAEDLPTWAEWLRKRVRS